MGHQESLTSCTCKETHQVEGGRPSAASGNEHIPILPIKATQDILFEDSIKKKHFLMLSCYI